MSLSQLKQVHVTTNCVLQGILLQYESLQYDLYRNQS